MKKRCFMLAGITENLTGASRVTAAAARREYGGNESEINMVRKVDITKKSNIKCEHCRWFNGTDCQEGGKYRKQTNYWNRCKRFKWRDDILGNTAVMKGR